MKPTSSHVPYDYSIRDSKVYEAEMFIMIASIVKMVAVEGFEPPARGL